jgi:predicted NUDIX family phosphoesterase
MGRTVYKIEGESTPENITTLEKKAKEILSLKHELGLRRPLVIEFCGTPKAGKTTTINALNIFLKRNDFKTVVISEMAAICPITNKTNFFFNAWTLFNSMAETLKQLTLGENKTDIIIIDRSIFDALCWFKWLSTNPEKNPYIDDRQYEIFVTFLVGTDMWTKNLDLVYIFQTEPETALKREFAELITAKTGSIMNTKVLKGFNESVQQIKYEFSKKFRRIEQYDTTKQDAKFVSLATTQNILTALQELLTEKIGYFLDTFAPYLKDGYNPYDVIFSRSLFFKDRNIVEEENCIQPVAIAVITDHQRKKVLVLKKNENKTTKDSPEYNRFLLYLGGHIRQEDKAPDDDNLTVFRNALQREIKEELNESITIGIDNPFLIYTPVSEKSKKHIAVCFTIEMDLENKKFNPTKDEFIHKNKDSKSGTVLDISEVATMRDSMETWSSVILSHVFKVNKTLFD